MSKWKDISTAPKDGTRIIISNGHWVDSGFWTTSVWASGGGWVSDLNRSDTYVFEDVAYWIPLPAAPKTNGAA